MLDKSQREFHTIIIELDRFEHIPRHLEKYLFVKNKSFLAWDYNLGLVCIYLGWNLTWNHPATASYTKPFDSNLEELLILPPLKSTTLTVSCFKTTATCQDSISTPSIIFFSSATTNRSEQYTLMLLS